MGINRDFSTQLSKFENCLKNQIMYVYSYVNTHTL